MPTTLTLTPPIIIVFTLMLFTMVLFISGRVRVDVVAVLVVVLIGLFQLLPANILFSGFSSTAVIALIGIMVMSRGLEKAGLMRILATFFSRNAHNLESRMALLVMSSAGIVAGAIQNFGAAVLFLPVLNRIALRTKIALPRLLMPMGFCAILGSCATLIGSSPLLLLNDLLAAYNDQISEPSEILPLYHLFSIAPIGITLLAIGLVYFFYLGPRLLPKVTESKRPKSTMKYFQRIYGVGGELCEIIIPTDSKWVGSTLRALEAEMDSSMGIVGVSKDQSQHVPPRRKTKLTPGCILVVLGPLEAITEFCKLHQLMQRDKLHAFAESLHHVHAGLCEIVIPPGSELVGQSLRDLHLRRHMSMQVLAVHRGKRVRSGADLRKVVLKPGDTLCAYSRWEALSELESNQDFLLVTTKYPKEDGRIEKLPRALFCLFLALGLVFVPGIGVAMAMVVGAVAMVYAQVLSIDDAYMAVSWRTVVLIAGLIPLGIAAEHTGAAAWLAQYIVVSFTNHPEWTLQLALALLSTVLTLLTSNVGATVLLVPIAINIGLLAGYDPRILALIVAICANNAFLIPTHQVSSLIMGPGQYQTRDFLRVGSGLSILFIIVVLILVRILPL